MQNTWDDHVCERVMARLHHFSYSNGPHEPHTHTHRGTLIHQEYYKNHRVKANLDGQASKHLYVHFNFNDFTLFISTFKYFL